MNLEKRGDYKLLYYQRRRFRFKCSCSIAFLRNVEPQGSAEYNAMACLSVKGRIQSIMGSVHENLE